MLKAFNFHAIGCLHAHAGEYRPCEVTVGNRTLTPPKHFRVASLMDDMVNRWWSENNPIELAAYVLWRINWIHPFVNGNGRTARAAAYLVMCLQAEHWIMGTPILPELLTQDVHQPRYIEALRHTDQHGDLEPLKSLLEELLVIQLSSDTLEL